MKLAHKKIEVRKSVTNWRSQGLKIALVPTMGALHEGHLSLIRQAREHADHVVVSVFVNPVQFGPGEDFDRYPRTLAADVEQCRKEGVSLVFAPDSNEMYGAGDDRVEPYISIGIAQMNRHLCGATRKGHFEGVLLVVNKLFNIVRPNVAVFGQKDIQQWFVIRQMAEEFDHGIEILMGPTLRENDGLAMSSRNRYLTPEERMKASGLFQALQRISKKVTAAIRDAESGRRRVPVDSSMLQAEAEALRENGFDVDYLSLVSTPDLQPAAVIEVGRLYVIAVAARLGNTRLIDNILLNTRKTADHDA
ncbi:pantoate--beta-alanine ligase [Balneolales bacterium ANBcel1]|nr:pantoate--beta-alanine ligase [Balneolales bacterium ANBcel1]